MTFDNFRVQRYFTAKQFVFLPYGWVREQT